MSWTWVQQFMTTRSVDHAKTCTPFMTKPKLKRCKNKDCCAHCGFVLWTDAEYTEASEKGAMDV